MLWFVLFANKWLADLAYGERIVAFQLTCVQAFNEVNLAWIFTGARVAYAQFQLEFSIRVALRARAFIFSNPSLPTKSIYRNFEWTHSRNRHSTWIQIPLTRSRSHPSSLSFAFSHFAFAFEWYKKKTCCARQNNKNYSNMFVRQRFHCLHVTFSFFHFHVGMAFRVHIYCKMQSNWCDKRNWFDFLRLTFFALFCIIVKVADSPIDVWVSE